MKDFTTLVFLLISILNLILLLLYNNKIIYKNNKVLCKIFPPINHRLPIHHSIKGSTLIQINRVFLSIRWKMIFYCIYLKKIRKIFNRNTYFRVFKKLLISIEELKPREILKAVILVMRRRYRQIIWNRINQIEKPINFFKIHKGKL